MSLIIFIIIVLVLFPPKEKKKTKAYKVDFVKLAKEQDMQRRERERQYDRARREQERVKREQEKEQKRMATATAESLKAKQYAMLAETYVDYINQLQAERADSSTSLARLNQIDKEIMRYKEKLVKLMCDADKAHYNARSYFGED